MCVCEKQLLSQINVLTKFMKESVLLSFFATLPLFLVVSASYFPKSLSQVSKSHTTGSLMLGLSMAMASQSGRVSPASAVESKTKEIIFLRHSTTENNEYLRENGWLPGFKDPGLRDTRLSAVGEQMVRDLNNKLVRGEETLDPNKIELLTISPLRRTLQTATIGLDKVLLNIPGSSKRPKCLICPLAAERVYMEADAGRSRSVLEKEWPQFDFSELPADDSPWWWTGDGNKNGGPMDPYIEWRVEGQYKVLGEPRSAFASRMVKFKQWLLDRPEQSIMVVAHWGTILSLTGKEFKNCELGRFSADQLLCDEDIQRAEV